MEILGWAYPKKLLGLVLFFTNPGSKNIAFIPLGQGNSYEGSKKEGLDGVNR